jgi:hypothetical protein
MGRIVVVKSAPDNFEKARPSMRQVGPFGTKRFETAVFIVLSPINWRSHV